MSELAKKPVPTTGRGVGRPSQADELTVNAAKDAAIIGFASLNMAVISFLGANCAATSAERDVAISAMQGMLESMTPEQAEIVSKYLNPFQLFAAFGSWTARIWRLKQEERAGDDGDSGSGPGPEAVVPPEGGNHRETAPTDETPPDDVEIPVEEIVDPITGKAFKQIPIEQLRRVPGTGMDGRS